MATVSQWAPFGPALDITATSASVTRTSATQYKVTIKVSWKTYWSNNSTWYKMEASSGGSKVVLHDGTYGSSGSSGTLTGTYSISGNGSATKTITVTFKNIHPDKPETYKTKNVAFNVTVPAWTSYTVTYNMNGGSKTSGTFSNQTKWKNQALTLHSISSSNPTNSGYTCIGWSRSSTATTATYTSGGSLPSTVNENVTLYAVWKPNKYTITFNKNTTDTVTNLPSSLTKTYGSNATIPSTKPKRTNYTFKGWAESSTGAVAYQSGATYSKVITSNTTLYAVWELAYTKPQITGFSIFRYSPATGAEDETGTGLGYSFTWKCQANYPVSSITLSCNPADTNGKSSITISATGTSGTYTKVKAPTLSLSADKSYTIKVTVQDSNGSNSVSKTLSSVRFPIDIRTKGTGVSFGKAAQRQNYVDFGWNACFDNQLKICGVDPSGNVREAFQPVNENGNTVVGWTNYNSKNGNTHVYGHDVSIGISNIASPTTFRPYRRQGDSMDITIRTSGYVTNSGKDVYFLIPLAVPIIGKPTATITSGTGFRLRQDNKYTHGCSSEATVTPTKYTGVVVPYVGVRVVASFSDTTNVTNNDSIGIDWNGTITFV